MKRFQLPALAMALVLFLSLSLQSAYAQIDEPLATCDASTRATTASLSLSDDWALADDQQTIGDFLNQGGTTAQLTEHLTDRGYIIPDRSTQDSLREPVSYDTAQFSNGVYLADIDGDDVQDVVIGMQDRPVIERGEPQVPMPLASAILVYRCADGQYEALPPVEYEVPAVFGMTGINLQAVADLTGDGAAELIYHTSMCGASTCFTDISVLTWDGAAFVELPGTPFAIPYGNYTVIPQDGVIIGTFGGYGSVGAGPQRTRELVYAYDGEAIVKIADIPLSSPNFTFEAAYDGFAALQSGDYTSAIDLFSDAFGTDTIQPFAFSDEEMADSQAIIDSLASYGILVATIARDGADSEAAVLAYNSHITLSPTVPFGDQSIDNLWRVYGITFFDTVRATGDLSAACAAVRAEYAEAIAMASTDDQVGLSGTNFWPYFGYGNPAPEADAVCPF